MLDIPWWIRVVSLVQRTGNDGLTSVERSFLARRYVKTGPGKKALSNETKAALRAWQERKRHG